MEHATRDEHLAWAKQRALEVADSGDTFGAVASMLSDLRKWEGGPLYDDRVLQLMTVDGMLFASKSRAATRHWIKGFN